jgi:hypothetical protein
MEKRNATTAFIIVSSQAVFYFDVAATKRTLEMLEDL